MTLEKIILSRTDSIGDVMLTLPMAGIIKKHFPNVQIMFLGKTYTQPVVRACEHIDEFINWDELNEKQEKAQIKEFRSFQANAIIHVFPRKEIASLAKKAGIPIRIGTAGRLFHVFTCNKKVRFTRRRSDLHEAQLNLKLLQPLKINETPSLRELSTEYGFSRILPLDEEFQHMLRPDKFNLIIHPKSKGSAVEWGLKNYSDLIRLLPDRFRVFITGTEEEGKLIRKVFSADGKKVYDMTGKLRLDQLISFIAHSDGLLAASTGPLHIAAACGIHAIGLFSPKRPIHPGRWAPIGKHAQAVVHDENCEKCKSGLSCNCIQQIEPGRIKKLLESLKTIPRED